MKPLNFAVIGAGRFAKHYIKLLNQTDGAKLSAVSSRTKESLDEIKDVALDAKRTTDSTELLNDPKIDAVVIATPPSTHFVLAKQALESGKHVLLEKPMVKNLQEAKNLKKIEARARSVFMVGHQYAYSDHLKYIKDNLDSIGAINFVEAEHLYPGPMRDDIGCLWDSGTHKLSMLQYLFNPGKITKIEGTSLDILGKGLDDFTSFYVEFQKGISASIKVSWMFPQRTRRLMVFGSKKTLLFDDISDTKVKFYKVIDEEKQKRSIFVDDISKINEINPEIPQINANDILVNQLNHFLSCVKSNKKPQTGMQSSFEITQWLDAISKKIKLPGYGKD